MQLKNFHKISENLHFTFATWLKANDIKLVSLYPLKWNHDRFELQLLFVRMLL
jgi:hypothetical protein